MTRITSISVSDEFHAIAKEFDLSWTDLARIGASVKFAELGVVEYDNSLNLVRKMNKFRQIAEVANQELDKLKNGKS